MKFSINLMTLLPLIMHGIQTAEGMKGATGAEKKAAALELVRTGLAGVSVAGKHPLDEPSALDAVSHGIDATVAAVNAIQKAKKAA